MPVDESRQGTASPRPAVIAPPDSEMVATPTRRRFTAENKLRILKMADACTAVGSLGARLRAEGLYASNLTTWRRQRTEGVRSALTPQQRGRKASARHPLRAENETLRKENVRLSTRLKQAELIISSTCKKSLTDPRHPAGDARGRRAALMAATQSLSTEIGIQPACDAFGLARSGFYRGQGPATVPAPRPSPPRTLSPEERSVGLATLHSDRFVDTAPAAVYATLLDEGRYPCSIRGPSTASSMSRQSSRSAGTNSATRSIRSRNSWRPPRIRYGRGTSRNSWAP